MFRKWAAMGTIRVLVLMYSRHMTTPKANAPTEADVKEAKHYRRSDDARGRPPLERPARQEHTPEEHLLNDRRYEHCHKEGLEVVEAGVVALLAGYVDIFIGEYVHQMGQVDRYKVQEQPGCEYGEEHQQADYPDNRAPPVAGWHATDKQPHIDPVPRSLPQDPGHHKPVESGVYNERLKEGVESSVRAADKEVGEYEHTNQYGDASEHPEKQATGPDPVKRVVRWDHGGGARLG